MNPLDSKLSAGYTRVKASESSGYELLVSPDDSVCLVANKETGQLKIANEVEFEQNFFTLAFTYIIGKAPNLTDSMLGFEVVDKNDEGTAAVGVFKFDLGGKELFVPVFYNNGQLKGGELLYFKDQDLFVPNTPDQVNYIINKSKDSLGDPAESSEEGRRNNDTSLRELYRTDSTKLAGDKPVGSKATNSLESEGDAPVKNIKEKREKKDDCCPDPEDYKEDSVSFTDMCGEKKSGSILEQWIEAAVGEGPSWGSLPDFIKDSGTKTSSVFMRTMLKYPDLHEAVHKFYGDSFVEEMRSVKESAAESEEDFYKDVESTPEKVHVFVEGVGHGLEEILTEDEKESLVTGGIAFRDSRHPGEKTLGYVVETDECWVNPSEAGKYELLTLSGEGVDVLVFPHSVPRSSNSMFATSIDQKQHLSGCKSSEVLVKACFTDGDFKKELDKLPKAGSMNFQILKDGFDADGSQYKFICPKTQAVTDWFRLKSKVSSDGVDCLQGYNNGMDIAGDSYLNVDEVIISDKYDEICLVGDSYLVPADACVLTKKDKGCSKLTPGSLKDIQLKEQANMDKIKVSSLSTGEYLISSTAVAQPKTATHNNALKLLVVEHGLGVKEARDIMDEVRNTRSKELHVAYGECYPLSKQAAGYDRRAVGGAPQAPAFPDSQESFDSQLGVNTMQSQDEELFAGGEMVTPPYAGDQIQGMHGGIPSGNPPPGGEGTLDDEAVNEIMQAAESGDKDVFDIASISQLLSHSDVDAVISRHLVEVEKALDRLGRLYFLTLYHQDSFSERFGDEDLPNLQDSLKDSFENLGKLILKLKENEVGSDPGTALEFDLGSVM